MIEPVIDWAGISPILALSVGLVVTLFTGLAKGSARVVVPIASLTTLGSAAGLAIWQWTGTDTDLIAGALRLDALGLAITLIAIGSAAFAVMLSLREPAAEEAGHGEYHALLLGSVLGMALLAMSQNLVTLFIAIELLSIPLYILCAASVRRPDSLESGLKYLVIGSLGSATLLYGLAFVYGGSGSTDFTAIAEGIRAQGMLGDPLILIGVALSATGLAFKASVAPFHQWTPDVYQGAPTPITGFMAVATKAAAFAILVRFFGVALEPLVDDWSTALAALAAITIAVGNIGAIGQDSLKRLLAYSGVAQAGYLLVGVVVATEAGVNALVFYLAAYTLMNLAAFAVVVARERETALGDHISALNGIGADRPLLAWAMTIAMLSLAGLPGTAGFIGKVFLIEAAVDGGYTWLGVAIVVGTMISLAYYLRVVAAIWMRPGESAVVAGTTPGEMPAMAGGAPEGDRSPSVSTPGGRQLELVIPALLAAGATIFFGVIPGPLADWAAEAGISLVQFLP